MRELSSAHAVSSSAVEPEVYGASSIKAGAESEGSRFLTSMQQSSKPLRAPRYAWMLAGCAAINSANFGFDIRVSSGVEVLLKQNLKLTDWQIGIFLGSLYFTATLGALTSHAVSDRLGRRRTFIAAQLFFLLGIPVLVFAGSFIVLLLGRVFIGLGVGVGFAIDSLYICEVAPAAHRGKLATWAEIAVNFGIMLGFVANWAFRDIPSEGGLDWRVMIACGAILPTIMVFLSIFIMPESPRWLIMQKRTAEATAILQRTHDPDEDIEGVVGAIVAQIETDERHASLDSLSLLREEPATVRLGLVALGVGVSQQINGSESVVMFSPVIFERAGVAQNPGQSFGVTILVGITKLVFIFLAAQFMDSVGRRPLFLLSMFAMSASLMVLAFSIAAELSSLSVVAVCCFIAAFSIGVGPVCWLLAAELFPTHIRARGMSLATASNRLTSGLVALTFLPLSGLMGQSAYFTFFAGITAVVAFVACAVVPETKGKFLEEMAPSFVSQLEDVVTRTRDASNDDIAERKTS